jgi:hypothetical protein
LRGLLETDPERAKAKIKALMGTFMLSPEIIEGAGYLRVSSDANFDGLILVATGDDSPKNGILGAHNSNYSWLRVRPQKGSPTRWLPR